MLCIPNPTTRSEKIEAFTPEKGENTSREMRKGPQFLIKETLKKGVMIQNFPSILVPHGSFENDLKDSFSMLAFVCGLGID